MTDDTVDPHALVDDVIGLLGDPHADFHWTKDAIEALMSVGVKQIHVLGDFQFVGSKLAREKKTLRRLSNVLKAGDAHLFVTGGNHEDYPALFRRYPVDEHGYRHLDTHITWLPRGWRGHTADGVVVASLGGANSIMRDQRDPATSGPIAKWWPEEQITEEDLAALGTERVDVLLAHDAPTTKKLAKHLAKHRQFWPPDGVAYAEAGRRMLQRAVEQVRPKLVMSGHYHRFLNTTETFHAPDGEAFNVTSIILNRSRRPNSTAILLFGSQAREFLDLSSKDSSTPVLMSQFTRKQIVEMASLADPPVRGAMTRLLMTAKQNGVTLQEVIDLLKVATEVMEEHDNRCRHALRDPADDLVWAGLYTAEEVEAAASEASLLPLKTLIKTAWDATFDQTVSTSDTAKLLRVSESTVRHRAARGSLYSFKRAGRLRYPLWQFDTSDNRPISHLEEVLAAVPRRMHGSVLRAFMISPREALQPPLTSDGGSSPMMSPAEWLAGGRDVQAVLNILSAYPVRPGA